MPLTVEVASFLMALIFIFVVLGGTTTEYSKTSLSNVGDKSKPSTFKLLKVLILESGAFSLTVTVLLPLKLMVLPASSVTLPSNWKLITPVELALQVVKKVLVVFLASPVASAHF